MYSKHRSEESHAYSHQFQALLLRHMSKVFPQKEPVEGALEKESWTSSLIDLRICCFRKRMPTYEVAFIMRKMAHPATVQALKRAAGEIYSSGGYIRCHKYKSTI